MLAPLIYEAGPTTLGLTSSLNRRCQIHYRQPLWSGYTHPSGARAPWVGPAAVWGDTDTAVWGSWRPPSRCPSTPSAATTWGPTGPGSMLSSAGRLGPAGPGGKYPKLQHLWGKGRGWPEHCWVLCNITSYCKHCYFKSNWLGVSSLQACLEFLNLHILALLGLHMSPSLFTQVDMHSGSITQMQTEADWGVFLVHYNRSDLKHNIPTGSKEQETVKSMGENGKKH